MGSQAVDTFYMTIDGKSALTELTIPVINPATGSPFAHAPAATVDDVVSRANDTEYGLSGAVWSNDIVQATAIAHRLDTGTVWINQNLQSTPFTPLAGAKQSGFGQENGLAGLLEFTRPKSIYIPKVVS